MTFGHNSLSEAFPFGTIYMMLPAIPYIHLASVEYSFSEHVLWIETYLGSNPISVLIIVV